MIVAAALTVLAGRFKRAREGKYNAEALSFVGAVFNALFIVVLAFYTVIAWTNSDSAAQHSDDEAAGLTTLYWQAGDFPDADRDRIRALIRDYTTEVADREWPQLGQGRADTHAGDLLFALRADLARMPTATDDIKSARDQATQTVQSITDSRQARIDQATGDGMLLTLMLIGTVLGAIAMIGFPLLMGFTADLRHVTGLAVLAGTLALVVYFSVDLAHPFSGLIKIDPSPFRAALAEYPKIP
jgi:hypothetical protein